jgi:hypothetical protein
MFTRAWKPLSRAENEASSMSDSHSFKHDPLVCRRADGSLVVVVRPSEPLRATDLEQLVHDARAFNACALWVFGGLIEPVRWFAPTGGYVRLEAAAPPVPLLLPEAPDDSVRALLITCFKGVWGRYEAASPDPASTYVGLYEQGRWVGICRVHESARWIDDPGVHPMLRTPGRSAQLVRGASFYLSPNRSRHLGDLGRVRGDARRVSCTRLRGRRGDSRLGATALIGAADYEDRVTVVLRRRPVSGGLSLV